MSLLAFALLLFLRWKLNVVLVSGVQQSDYIYIFIYIFFFRFLSIIGYYKILNIIPCVVLSPSFESGYLGRAGVHCRMGICSFKSSPGDLRHRQFGTTDLR